MSSLETCFPVKRAKIDCASSGDNTLVAAQTAKKYVVMDVLAVAGGTVNIKFRSGTTDLMGAIPLVANAGFAPSEAAQAGHFETAPGEALNLNLSAAVQVSGWVTYVEIG